MPIPCARCRRLEDIPTSQFVKVDLEVHYLCRDCWEQFRHWLYRRMGFRPGQTL